MEYKHTQKSAGNKSLPIFFIFVFFKLYRNKESRKYSIKRQYQKLDMTTLSVMREQEGLVFPDFCTILSETGRARLEQKSPVYQALAR